MSAYREANLRALADRHAAAHARVIAASPLAAATVAATTGVPTLEVGGVLLHSRHDPMGEATRWAATQRPRLDPTADTAVVLGFGLGYHIEALAAVWPGRIVVVEPDASLLATALDARDLRPLLARVELAPESIGSDTIDGWGRVAVAAHAPSLLREGEGLRSRKERIAGRTALRDLRLRILVVSPLTGGSYPLTGYCARALAELGHAVTVLDTSPFASALGGIGGFTPKKAVQKTIGEAFANFLGRGVLAAVEHHDPDLVLGMAQAPLSGAVLRELGRRGTVRAMWFVEDHRLFGYWKDVIAEYDHFFTIQAGEFLATASQATAGQVAYLPCAADPAVHRPFPLCAEERAELGSPVGFLGAGYHNRRIAFRSLLDLGLKLWGTQWKGSGQLESAVQRGGARITTDDMVRIFNATDVNLNLHSSTYVDGVDPRGDFVNPRTFELAACGAFQLVDERALLPSLLRPGTEVATFTDTAELRPLVEHWLARPDERAAIAAAGRARVLAEHTYRHRMEALLEAICARDADRLRARSRGETVADVGSACGDTPLGRFLGELSPSMPFSLAGVAKGLLARPGRLSDPEAILLFLRELDGMYVEEHRT
jgi:spore maturation protein CgeB